MKEVLNTLLLLATFYMALLPCSAQNNCVSVIAINSKGIVDKDTISLEDARNIFALNAFYTQNDYKEKTHKISIVDYELVVISDNRDTIKLSVHKEEFTNEVKKLLSNLHHEDRLIFQGIKVKVSATAPEGWLELLSFFIL